MSVSLKSRNSRSDVTQPISPLLQWSHAELKTFLIDSIPHHAALGLQILDCGAGWVSMMIPYVEHLADVGGGIDPAAVTTLVDTACGSVPLTMLTDLRRTATLELRTDFIRGCHPGRDVRCEARCVQVDRNVAFVQAEVHDGESSGPVAIATGLFAIFSSPKTGASVT